MAFISRSTNGLDVPGTTSADSGLQALGCSGLDNLPVDAAHHFTLGHSFFASRAWWETILAHGIPGGARPEFVLIGDRGLFPMLHDPASGGFRALTTPYTCLYEPVGDAACHTAFARFCRSFPTTRLDALPAAAADALAVAGGRAGLSVARFEHFGNWYEDITGLDWSGYLARRPGATRETIRRRTRRAERMADTEFHLFRDETSLDRGIAAFEEVYARSWKDPEPFPAFNEAQIRAAARQGVMRLGVWWIGGIAAAVQFWIVERNKATVLKLAHDEVFKAHSPGTVVTAWMIRHMIEQEGATELDFGRGDDPYKKNWVASRRPRMGVLLINPRHPKGLLALTRHTMGRIKARFHSPV